MGEWQPIESAPREPLDEHGYGPDILLFVDDTCGRGMWDRDFNKFYVEFPDTNAQPTHWMPLPPPPRTNP